MARRATKTSSAPQEDALPAYAPRRTTSLIGHCDAETEFLAAWTSGRLHHAWLISGPRGIGKATLAYRMARFLLAKGETGGEGLDMPATHPVFRRVLQGSHGDFHVLERRVDEKTKKLRSEIIVGDVREAAGFLSKTAAEGGWRVVLIDAVDEMNTSSSNAILKVLEEPPEKTVLLLVCHNLAALLPTLRSRCRRLPLQPLPEEAMTLVLRDLLPDLGGDDHAALSRLSEGRPGRALELAGLGGLDLYRSLIGLLRTLPRLDIPEAHALGNRVALSADAFRTVMELFQWWLGRMISALGRGEEPPEVVPGENGLIRWLGSTAPLERWGEVWEKTAWLIDRAVTLNLDRKMVLLSTVLAVERAANSNY